MTTPPDETIAAEKMAAARRAVELVEPGMRVGLGSGSTVDCVIDALRARFPTPPLPFIIVAAASRHAEERLVAAGLVAAGFSRGFAGGVANGFPAGSADGLAPTPVPAPALDLYIDLYIDGADEVDPDGSMIKGGGGALVREKILAAASHTVVIAVDSRKPVAQLGTFPLPIAVQQFGWQTTARRLASRVTRLTRRTTAATDDAYVTDDGQYILDCEFESIPDPAELDRWLRSITGIVETGLFVGLADWIVIGRGHDTEVRQIVRGGAISTTLE